MTSRTIFNEMVGLLNIKMKVNITTFPLKYSLRINTDLCYVMDTTQMTDKERCVIVCVCYFLAMTAALLRLSTCLDLLCSHIQAQRDRE